MIEAEFHFPYLAHASLEPLDAVLEVKDGKAVGIRMKAISDITDFSYDFHDLDLKRE